MDAVFIEIIRVIFKGTLGWGKHTGIIEFGISFILGQNSMDVRVLLYGMHTCTWLD